MVTGGSILGDKTRMARLAAQENAFIRPSPSVGALGGVANTTPRSITVLEAAGYDVVLVETVGVGQSEAAVHASVDCLCVLMLAGAGDELQAVKRGVLELADVLAVNKADVGDGRAARLAAAELRRALPLLVPSADHGPPPVLTVSALTGAGLDELWDSVAEHRRLLDSTDAVWPAAEHVAAWPGCKCCSNSDCWEQFESQPGLAARRAELEQAVETRHHHPRIRHHPTPAAPLAPGSHSASPEGVVRPIAR